MCTVVVSVRRDAAWPVVLLGVRDEFEKRSYDPFGAWWPRYGPGLVGLRDREAGGAWMALDRDAARLGVVLNRAEAPVEPAGGWVSRGGLPLDAAHTGSVPDAGRAARTRPYNLVTADGDGVRVQRWDGGALTEQALPDGVHMITHGDADDPQVDRVATWLPALRALPAPTGPLASGSWRPWLDLVALSTAVAPDDPTALLRCGSLHGHTHRTLFVCAAALAPGAARLDGVDVPVTRTLPDPATWTPAA